MKVLMINGSPRAGGNTSIALGEMEKIFAQEGVETEILSIGNQDIRSCIACGRCAETGKCAFDDIVNEAAPADMTIVRPRRSMMGPTIMRMMPATIE